MSKEVGAGGRFDIFLDSELAFYDCLLNAPSIVKTVWLGQQNWFSDLISKRIPF